MEMTTTETVTSESDGSLLRITLNRPRRFNMLTCTSMHRLAATLETADNHTVIVLHGAGRAFCAGGDLRDLGGSLDEFREISHEVFRRLRETTAVTIAAIHGHAIGAGLLLALHCDARIATADASFALPELRNDVLPNWPAALRHAAEQLGPSTLRWLLLSGAPIKASDAQARGIVHDIASDLDSAVANLAGRISAYPPGIVAATKVLLDEHSRSVTRY